MRMAIEWLALNRVVDQGEGWVTAWLNTAVVLGNGDRHFVRLDEIEAFIRQV